LQFKGSYVFEDLTGDIPLMYPKTLQFYTTFELQTVPSGRRYQTMLLPSPWVDKSNMLGLFTTEKLTRSNNEKAPLRMDSLCLPEHEEYFRHWYYPVSEGYGFKEYSFNHIKGPCKKHCESDKLASKQMLIKRNNFADTFMEAVGIMGSPWSQDEDCKTILERMEAEENKEEMDSDGTLRRRVVRPRRKTPPSDGKSSMDASTEDGEEAHDDASDDDDEPSDEDTTSSPK